MPGTELPIFRRDTHEAVLCGCQGRQSIEREYIATCQLRRPDFVNLLFLETFNEGYRSFASHTTQCLVRSEDKYVCGGDTLHEPYYERRFRTTIL